MDLSARQDLPKARVRSFNPCLGRLGRSGKVDSQVLESSCMGKPRPCVYAGLAAGDNSSRHSRPQEQGRSLPWLGLQGKDAAVSFSPWKGVGLVLAKFSAKSPEAADQGCTRGWKPSMAQ